ncbi:hypothetical protein ACROYT_G015452 [Oculina patagonica]
MLNWKQNSKKKREKALKKISDEHALLKEQLREKDTENLPWTTTKDDITNKVPGRGAWGRVVEGKLPHLRLYMHSFFIIGSSRIWINSALIPLFRERTRTNFFAVTWQKLQCCNPIKYSNRTALDNDLRIVAAAMNHRVPSAGDVLEKIIEDYKNKAKSTKSVQNDNAHHTYSDPLSMLQKQSVNHKSPITIHNQ